MTAAKRAEMAKKHFILKGYMIDLLGIDDV